MKNALRFSLFHKLIIANVLYAIPAVALIWLMVEAKNGNINFARWELKGNEYQKPLEHLLENISNLRMNSIHKNEIDTEGFAKIDRAFRDLKVVHDKLAEDLQFTVEGLGKRKRDQLMYDSVLSRWEKVKAAKSLDESVEGLGGLVADMRGMITHSGDTSNLILDPDLDSYYLMDITLLALPQTQDRLQDLVKNFGNVIDKDVKLTPKNRIELAVYAALFKQSDLDRIVADVQTVIQEDPNFYGVSPTAKANLEPTTQAFTASMEKMIAMLNDLSGSATSTVSRDEFFATVQAAHDQAFRSWDVAAAEMDALLLNRDSILSADKYQSLAIALMALGLAFSILFWVALGFNQNMKRILQRLKTTLGETRTASGRLVSLASELSSATNDQAAALQSTASALEEINGMVKSTVANTENANRTADRTLSTVETSEQAMGSMVSAMNEISQGNEQILQLMQNNGQKMGEITGIISSIGDKTKVINDIVFQTKLLSFNASVEAARAGEHGKGFAVVAEEVGNLAAMSGNASHEIAGLLENSVQQVQRISSETTSQVGRALESGKSRVRSGADLADQCQVSMQTVLREFREVKENVDTIFRAAEEQAKGIQDITQAISRIDGLTNENAGMSKETAEQSHILSEQAQQIEAIVVSIESEVLGRSVGAEAPRKAS